MAESSQIWAEALRTLERAQPFALATVINVRGSTPREIGAKMIVREDGQVGTIGGGCGEAEVFRKARLLLHEGSQSRIAEVDLTGDFDQQQIGTCGGIMEVLISRWTPIGDVALARRAADCIELGQAAALLTTIEGDGSGNGTDHRAHARDKALFDPSGPSPGELFAGFNSAALATIEKITLGGKPALLEMDQRGELKPANREPAPGAVRLFIDPVIGAQRLIIAGAGHIAQPLANLGSMLGFLVTVIDDRASFANPERFPDAAEIIVKPFGTAIDELKLDRYSYLVAITRGHAFDEEAVRSALKQPCGFVGMIGSRRRVKATLARLEEEGVNPDLLDQVHAPLGLDIGAETPEEIAVAIIAEIIRERRTGRRDDFTLGSRSGRLKRHP